MRNDNRSSYTPPDQGAAKSAIADAPVIEPVAGTQREEAANVLNFVITPFLPALVLFASGPLKNKLACPTTALACWSTGQSDAIAAILGTALMLGAVVLRMAWLKERLRAVRLVVIVRWVVALTIVATLYRAYEDTNKFTAVVDTGLLVVTSAESTPTSYRWDDVESVLGWCETGSRSGPRMNFYFKMRDGTEVGVPSGEWGSAARQQPLIVRATDRLPYRTKNIDSCRKFHRDAYRELNSDL